MRTVSLSAFIAIALSLASAAGAEVISVPGIAANIKSAVAMATSGDEIVIGPGTWSGANNRDVHLQGKQLWIHSAEGVATCIIDGGGVARGFILDGGEANGTLVEGITFRNCRVLGFYQTGGAIITAATSSLAVHNCEFDANITDLNGRGGAISNAGVLVVTDTTFKQNIAYYYGGRGGAIYNLTGGTLTVSGCTFNQNIGNEASGGAIGNDGIALLSDSTFTGNTGQSGGALWNTGSLDVQNCTFQSNSAKGGGAASISAGAASFESCTFLTDTSVIFLGGGGAFLVSGTAQLSVTRCRLLGSIAGSNGGGGFLVNGGNVEITDSLISGCGSGTSGAGIRVNGGAVFVRGCTVAQNSVTGVAGGGAGLVVNGTGSATVSNSIVWGNTAIGITGQAAQIAVAPTALLTLSSSCLEGLDGALGGIGNIGDNPLFTLMLGADGVKGTLDDDLRLTSASPCIDSGSNALVPAFSTNDLDGNSRISDGDGDSAAITDMGAYERANPFDLTGDGLVTASDLTILLGTWGGTGPNGDFDGDGIVDAADLAILLRAWTTLS